MEGRWWLGPEGSETLFETGWGSFAERDFEINREGRVANGDLVIDCIATKKQWTIGFPATSQATKDALQTEFDRGTTLSLIIEEEDTSTTTYTVKFRPMRTLRIVAMDNWRWRIYPFVLEEV